MIRIQDPQMRLKIRESSANSSSSPIERQPTKGGHVNPYGLLEEDEYDSDAEQSEVKPVTELTEAKPALHIDVDARVQSPSLASPTLTSPLFAKSPPPRKPAVKTPTSAKTYKPKAISSKPPTTPTAMTSTKPTKFKSVEIKPVKTILVEANPVEKKLEAKPVLNLPTAIQNLQQKLLVYLDTLVEVEAFMPASDELKNDIQANFKVDITKMSFAVAFNLKLQELLTQKNSVKLINFFRSIIDSGLFQKLFPHITNLAEAEPDIVIICRVLCQASFDKGDGSMLKAFYDKLLMMTNSTCDQYEFIAKCLPLKEFYHPLFEYNRRSKSVDELNNWLQYNILAPRFICHNLSRLVEEDLLEKIFPGVGTAVTTNFSKFRVILKQIESKEWSYETYWSTNPNKRYNVGVEHLVYAHMIVCALDQKTINVKQTLIALIEKNELFKRTFNHYQEPSPYYNLFEKAFATMHGAKELNPFTTLNNSGKGMKFNFGTSSMNFFGGTPRAENLVTSNQDWRIAKHANTFTP